ncbi:MAG: isoaspartyl peptidase/L-asparaginase [Candidatus Promineifilaceae bacterium]|nr:isoaspartyl peptidase/L-asparaginase [Candidatus Promineifilaceae bacterium]
MIPNIIAHGGAWYWDDELDAIKRDGLERAVGAGYAVLLEGGSALDAVEQTVILLENNPVFDAGSGGYLNQDGIVELDALIVDGSKRDFAGIAGVTRVRNPVVLARKVMEETDYCFFIGEGANRMAHLLGIPLVANQELVTDAMKNHFLDQRSDGGADTVGAVAIDYRGNVAAATSTSGSPYKPAGRVGDSPIMGAGGYAENGVGAAGATGQGENSMRVLLSKYACDQLAAGLTAQEAATAAIAYIEEIIPRSMSGVIVIDHHGNRGMAHSTPKMAAGWIDELGHIHSATRSSSE